MVEYSWELLTFLFELLSQTQPESIITWAHLETWPKQLTVRSYYLTPWSHNRKGSIVFEMKDVLLWAIFLGSVEQDLAASASTEADR